ncbi:MAG: HU family DNA-binding protein [Pseudomonadota bacterium]
MSGKTVTRAELANAVYRLGLLNRKVDPSEPISREKSAELVESVLQIMTDAVVEGASVKISSFGAFDVREKAARIGRNPRTGEEAEITPRRVLVFRASHILKNRMNGEAQSTEAQSTEASAADAAKEPGQTVRVQAKGTV